MAETAEAVLLIEGRGNEEGLIDQAIAAAERQPSDDDRVLAALEVLVNHAEADPGAVRAELLELRRDHLRLAGIEACLGGSRNRATLGLGAAVQLAVSELSSPAPDLRGRLPELIRWLRQGW